MLRLVYDRDESFQLLLTFALLLMLQDMVRMGWGSSPQQVDGRLSRLRPAAARHRASIPVWNVLVLAAALAVAAGLGAFLRGTNFGRLLRATAENRRMAASLGVDTGKVYAVVFTLGTALGGIGGALVVPSAAATPEMAVELVVEAFAVVVIGGLGSMAGRARRGGDRRRAPRRRAVRLAGAGAAGGLRRGGRGAAAAPGRAVREAGDVKRAAAAALALAGDRGSSRRRPSSSASTAPRCCCPSSAMAWRCSGSTCCSAMAGSCSFGHAMFVAIGAYAAAVTTGVWRIESFEAALLAAAGGRVRSSRCRSAPSARATRKIFFGMLTLAFGMLFHSFLFKFYALTGGDQGMRVPRPTLLGLEFEELDKTEFLVGPFYWYCLALAALLALLMWRVVRSPFGLAVRAQRDNPRKAEYLGVEVHRTRFVAFLVAAVFGAVGGAMLAVPVGPRRPGAGLLDAFGDAGVHGRCSAAPRTSPGRCSARWPMCCCRTR